MSERENRDGIILSSRVWALLETAYRNALLNPTTDLRVVKGSWDPGGSLSGTTHDKAGAFDLDVSQLTEAERERLVVELRKLYADSWVRDRQHGGFALHVHGIVADESPLSDGAQWQVDEYNAGRNGLSDRGPDYHPRPKQTPFDPEQNQTTPSTPPLPGEPAEDDQEDDMFIFRTHGDADPEGEAGGGAAYVVFGTRAFQCAKNYTIDPEVQIISSSSEAMDRAFYKALTLKVMLKDV